MKKQIQQLLQSVLANLGLPDFVPEVEIPENPTHGEYTTNVAMKAAKILKNLPAGRQGRPMEIALQVVERINDERLKMKDKTPDPNSTKSGHPISPKLPLFPLLQAIDRVEAVPPGFINFHLSEASLITELVEVLNQKEAYGTAPSIPSDPSSPSRPSPKIMVEYTDPNPFKEFHIGHLYSNAVGESLSRLFEASGSSVARADYFGDVGMHAAKAIWGMQKKFKIKDEIKRLEKLSLAERVKWMGEAYAEGSKAFEEDPPAAEEMKRFNKLIFIAAQELLAQKTGNEPMVDYRKGDTINPAELAAVKALFDTSRQWSLDYFETIYVRLGTKFDLYYPESEVAEYGAKLVLDNVGKVFEESQGAIIYRGESEGLHTRVFINRLGLPTYEAKEFGLNWKKSQDWPFDASYIVTGKEITQYFHVLLSAMGKVMPEVAAKTRHIGHGMVRLPAGKMTSRSGSVITGESLLDSVKQKIYDILNKSESVPQSEKDVIAEAAAVAAVKYSFLKVSLPSDITFDLGKSVSFEGDSGPYLLYTYARCKSVLRKAGDMGHATSDMSLNSEERAVARLILLYPDVVAEAAENLSPSTICTHLNRLASAYNLFYAKHQILGEPKRLALTAATAQVLKNGLSLLGIPVVEQM